MSARTELGCVNPSYHLTKSVAMETYALNYLANGIFIFYVKVHSEGDQHCLWSKVESCTESETTTF